MKIAHMYKLARLARKAGGDRYEAVVKPDLNDPAKRYTDGAVTDVLYINQRYSRATGPPVEVILVTFDFGEEEDGL